jgi:hypothetical protein
MSIRIVCPSCRKVYNVGEAMQGKTVRCHACQTSIAIPALARKGAREGPSQPSEERIATSSRPAGAAGRASRDEDDEPRHGPAELRSSREGKDSPGGKNLLPILLGVGAAAAVVLIGLVIGGVVLITYFSRARSSQAAVDKEPPPVVVQGKVDAPPAPAVAPVSAPPADNAPPVADPPAENAPPSVPMDGPPAGNEPPPGPAPGPVPGGDLAALKGTWQSGPVGADGGGAAGTIKLNISPQPGSQGGRLRLEIATKQGGRTTSSTMNYSFTLQQKGGDRLLVTTIRRGVRGTVRGLVFSYRFEGGQLLLSGVIATNRIAYTLKNVALRRTSAEPQMADSNPANPATGAPR